MAGIGFSILLVLHGLVHVWYVLLAGNIVAFKEEMGWKYSVSPLHMVLSDNGLRTIALIVYSSALLFFVISGITFHFNKAFSLPALWLGVLVSSGAILLFFDWKFEMLVQKGLIGFLINIGLATFLLCVK